MPTRPQNEGDACGAGHTVQLCFILKGHSSRKQRVAVREHSQALLHRTLIARKGSEAAGPGARQTVGGRERLVSLYQVLTWAAAPLWKPEQAEGGQALREVTSSSPSG